MLQRLFHIMRKTGHRVVVVDPDTERAYVLLPFSVYEDLLDRAGDENDAMFDDDDHDFEHIASAWDEEDADDRPLAPMIDEVDDVPEMPLSMEVEESPSEAPDLTPPDLIDTINRDIAAWRAEMAGAEVAPAPALDDLTLTPVPGEQAAQTPQNEGAEEKFYIEPI